MTLTIGREKLPLKIDRDGVMRVGGTRVTLDTVVAAFKRGAAAEEIVQQYPTLALADIYTVIGYYLRNQAEVDQYLQEAQAQARTVHAENEARNPSAGIRERLLARRAKRGSRAKFDRAMTKVADVEPADEDRL